MRKIDPNKHYFALMEKIDMVVPVLGITISGGFYNWCECVIDESQYKVKDGYKVTLKPIDPAYRKGNYDYLDFLDSLQSGHIVEKTSDRQKIEYIEEEEPIGSGLVIKHTGYVIVNH